jgi:hypothetical protein
MMCNRHLRLPMTKSSILRTVLGLNKNLGSNVCMSKRDGTLVSSSFAATDRQATANSCRGHPLPFCTKQQLMTQSMRNRAAKFCQIIWT